MCLNLPVHEKAPHRARWLSLYLSGGKEGLNTSKNVCLFRFPKMTFLNVTKHRVELEGTPWMDKNPTNKHRGQMEGAAAGTMLTLRYFLHFPEKANLPTLPTSPAFRLPSLPASKLRNLHWVERKGFPSSVEFPACVHPYVLPRLTTAFGAPRQPRWLFLYFRCLWC